MATSADTWFDYFIDLSIAGVKSIDPPVGVVDSARWPCKFVDSYSVDEGGLRAKATGGAATLGCRIVIVMGAMGQDTQKARWSALKTMVQAARAAIKGMSETDANTSLVVVGDANIDDSGYFGVTATITQNEWGT